MANRRDGIETRGRILRAACEVFAETGFRGTTNAEICRRSKVNGAAVNYHFHSKEALYQEAFKLALKESLEAHPPKTDEAARPEIRLRNLVFSIVNRISDPGNMAFLILRKEMGEPTRMLDDIMHDFISEECQELKGILKELLPGAGEKLLELTTLSVLSQCVHPSLMERGRREHGHKPPLSLTTPFDANEVAEHVYSFSMAALNSMADELVRRRASQA
jgi:AcrR family transcriptional regulator